MNFLVGSPFVTLRAGLYAASPASAHAARFGLSAAIPAAEGAPSPINIQGTGNADHQEIRPALVDTLSNTDNVKH